jgi:hypothetical protein
LIPKAVDPISSLRPHVSDSFFSGNTRLTALMISTEIIRLAVVM